MLCPTWKKSYELTGDDTKRQVVIQGGRTMRLRFNDKGRYVRSFLAADSNFIDIMMNVGIIAYAALETGDDDLMAIAQQVFRSAAAENGHDGVRTGEGTGTGP